MAIKFQHESGKRCSNHRSTLRTLLPLIALAVSVNVIAAVEDNGGVLRVELATKECQLENEWIRGMLVAFYSHPDSPVGSSAFGLNGGKG